MAAEYLQCTYLVYHLYTLWVNTTVYIFSRPHAMIEGHPPKTMRLNVNTIWSAWLNRYISNGNMAWLKEGWYKITDRVTSTIWQIIQTREVFSTNIRRNAECIREQTLCHSVRKSKVLQMQRSDAGFEDLLAKLRVSWDCKASERPEERQTHFSTLPYIHKSSDR